MSMNHPTIKVALLSYGMSGYVFHGPLLSAHPDFEIAAVYHRSNKKSLHHFPVATSLESILDNTKIEVVIVNTPNETHFEYASRALEAGKHVVVEKPFTVTKAQAQELIDIARRNDKILTVFQNRRWDGDFLTVKKVIDEKQLGDIVEYECHYDRFRNIVDLSSWKEKKLAGTGVIYNLGSHMIDQVLTLFGRPIYVDARVGVQRPNGVVDDYYDIRLEYETMMAIVKSSYLVREPGPRYMAHGTLGSFVKYGIDPQEEDLKAGKVPGSAGWGTDPQSLWGKLHTEIDGKVVNKQIPTLPGNYLIFYNNLSTAIRNKASLLVKPEEAMLVIEVIEAAIASSRSKCAIKL
jgi:scyllo-inositol 2-dehydrogenase (NADP+)